MADGVADGVVDEVADGVLVAVSSTKSVGVADGGTVGTAEATGLRGTGVVQTTPVCAMLVGADGVCVSGSVVVVDTLGTTVEGLAAGDAGVEHDASSTRSIPVPTPAAMARPIECLNRW